MKAKGTKIVKINFKKNNDEEVILTSKFNTEASNQNSTVLLY